MSAVLEPFTGNGGNDEHEIIGTGGKPSAASDDNRSGTSVGPNGELIADPTIIGSRNRGNGNDSPGSDAPRTRRKYTRRAGTASAGGKTANLDVNAVQAILFSSHQMLAAITKIPELKIEQAESKQLAEAAANVARHYNVQASAKAIDISNLVMVCIMLYGSRIYAINARMKSERAQRAEPRPTNPANNPPL